MSDNNADRNELQVEGTSGAEVYYEGGYRAITGVINEFELKGDDVRANLLAKIKEAVTEAKSLRENAKRLLVEQPAGG